MENMTQEAGATNMVTRLPTFMVIGAAKSGTTSLAVYLEQHPEVFFCPYKEPNYFAFAEKDIPLGGPASASVIRKLLYPHSVTKFETYRKLFDGVENEKAVGEASVRYLYYEGTASRIKERLPDVKLVVVLRDPISRLYSHYCMNVQNQLEPLDLNQAISAEDARRHANWGWDWHYVNVGLYGRQLAQYLRHFPREQIKVFFYEDFVSDPLRVFSDICRHVEVDPTFAPDMSYRGKPAYRPKYLALDRWLHWPRSARPGIGRIVPRWLPHWLVRRLERWNSSRIPPLSSDTHEELKRCFKDDVAHLEDLLGRRTPWDMQ